MEKARRGGSESGAAGGSIKVAAAADLNKAFQELGVLFEKNTGTKVVFTFGSTGNLAKQLSEGAPFDLFAAANKSFVDEVVKEGACDGATASLYGRGRIVVWTRKGAAPAAPASLTDLADARFAKIAIANPEHAPYGKAAKQALEAAGLWATVQPKLVYGENVLQTLQFAETGNADAAIVALSLAKTNDKGDYMLVDDALHKPLDQALVVCRHGKAAAGARDFAALVNSPQGRSVMSHYGFVLPGESTAATAATP